MIIDVYFFFFFSLSQTQPSHQSYKNQVGPVLCVSHGMGVPSVGILLHEMIKLMYHAKCKDPIFIRIGTCGGIGVEGGTVIITDDAIDGLFRSTFELVKDHEILCLNRHENIHTNSMKQISFDLISNSFFSSSLFSLFKNSLY